MKQEENKQLLYLRILGEAWHRLAEPVRAAHAPAFERRGVFRVNHCGNRFLRRLLLLSGLPREAKAEEVRLTIHAGPGVEKWERHFGQKAFTTLQSEDAGKLCERLGCWELWFTLTEIQGAVDYRQCRAGVRLGGLRLPLPSALAPRVQARETAEGADRVRVRVSVSLPWWGELLTYDGYLVISPSVP